MARPGRYACLIWQTWVRVVSSKPATWPSAAAQTSNFSAGIPRYRAVVPALPMNSSDNENGRAGVHPGSARNFSCSRDRSSQMN